MEGVTSRVKSFRLRDLSLVILCGLIIYLFRAHDSYSIVPVWRKMSKAEHFLNGKFPTLDERLPSPVITDLESDGVNEILLITSDFRLRIMAMPDQEGESTKKKFDARVLPNVVIKASTDLPVNLTSMGEKEEWPVVMETGYLTPYKSVVQVRKQVVIIVLDSWTVLCYDHRLQLLWSRQLMDVGRIAEGYSVKSMAALITPVSLQKDDQGLVVIAGSFIHTAHQKQQQQQHRHSHSAHSQATQNDLTHFSTFALSGQDGTTRWHHLPVDFNTQKTPDQEEPFHWKLGLKTAHLHVGESPWIYFHNDLLPQLPHSWHSNKDTFITMANVKKHSVGQSTAEPPVTEAMIGALGGEHIMGYAYGGLRPHSSHEHVDNANVVVSHNHDGVEVLNLQTGRPVTKITLPESPAVYLDIDRDTIIDKVTFNLVNDISNERICRVESQSMMGRMKKKSFETSVCDSWRFFWGWTAPEREDTVKHLPPLAVNRVAEKRSIFQHLLGDHLKSVGKSWDIITIISSGRVTSLSLSGTIQWQVDTSINWVNEAIAASSDQFNEHGQRFYTSFLPGMKEMSLQVYGKKDSLVVIGWRNMVLVDLKQGRVLGEHTIPCQPTDVPIIGDFDNDGWNDVLLTCPLGYIGFSIQKQPNHVYTAVYGAGVFLGILMLTWCLMSDEDQLTEAADLR